jgi:hypothetical protein
VLGLVLTVVVVNRSVRGAPDRCSAYRFGTGEMITVAGTGAGLVCITIIASSNAGFWVAYGSRANGATVACRIARGTIVIEVYDLGEQLYGRQTCRVLTAVA